MKYNIRKNWLAAIEVMAKHPVVILPFIFIAFFECAALEIIYFSTRNPVGLVFNPIIKKFFGEGFLHYPVNLVLLPKLFYYMQVGIYVLIGAFLTAISVNIFKNIKDNLPVRANAMIRNSVKTYGSFFIYAVILVILIALTQKLDHFVFIKFARLLSRYFSHLPPLFYNIFYLGSQLVTNVILQSFFVLTIPLIVIEKRPFLKAVFGSILTGARNFFKIFTMIFLPCLFYSPVIALKSDPARLIGKTFPEITVAITMAGIVIAIFLDCFIIICVSQFLLDKQKTAEKTA